MDGDKRLAAAEAIADRLEKQYLEGINDVRISAEIEELVEKYMMATDDELKEHLRRLIFKINILMSTYIEAIDHSTSKRIITGDMH